MLSLATIFTFFCLPLKDWNKSYILYKTSFQHIKFFKQRNLCDVYERGSLKQIFNDPELQKQWYFVKSNPFFTHLSHNLDYCWKHGIYGNGVTIGIIGGGIHFMYADIYNNFNRYLSYNFVESSYNIYPRDSWRSTISAGLISAFANNYICGTGAAPMSSFASLQIVGNQYEKIDYKHLSSALIFNNDLIHIYLINSVSQYNIEVNRRFVDILRNSFEKGMKFGRNNLGSIFIAGSGDQRENDNNCAFNFLLQQPEILVFGSINNLNNYTTYSEHCTAILAASISKQFINRRYKFSSLNNHSECQYLDTESLNAATISAGIIALLISENPNLTTRQIMILIILTSTQYDPNAVLNNAAFYYSYSYGFGLLNAEKMIQWSRVQAITYLFPENQCSSKFIFIDNQVIRYETIKIYIYSSGCLDYPFCVTEIEQVYLIISLKIRKRNCISIYITSPLGTRFQIINPRNFDKSKYGFVNWKLKILGYFAESPKGIWTLEIDSLSCKSVLTEIMLIFYGTCANSQINVYSHGLVKKFICDGNLLINSYIYNIVCKPKNTFSNFTINSDIQNHGKDIFAFSTLSTPDILALNDLT